MGIKPVVSDVSAFDAVVPFLLLADAWVLGIRTSERGLRAIEFLPLRPEVAPRTPQAAQAAAQLAAYFSDPAYSFVVPLDLRGSDFQLRVWQQLSLITAGKPWTYSELADRLGSGARAVGNACRRNPLPVVLPCHRVVAKSGLGGFAGSTQGSLMDIKSALLAHELLA